VNLDIRFEDCEFSGGSGGMVSGIVEFDEFGVIKSVSVNSSSLGKKVAEKKQAKQMLADTAERVRADLIREGHV